MFLHTPDTSNGLHPGTKDTSFSSSVEFAEVQAKSASRMGCIDKEISCGARNSSLSIPSSPNDIPTSPTTNGLTWKSAVVFGLLIVISFGYISITGDTGSITMVISLSGYAVMVILLEL